MVASAFFSSEMLVKQCLLPLDSIIFLIKTWVVCTLILHTDQAVLNYLCDINNVCRCKAGYFSTSGGPPCSPCAPGTYVWGAYCCALFADKTSCPSCPKGTYASGSAATECLFCELGKYQNSTKQTTCTNCTKGTYQSQLKQETCGTCQAGKYSSLAGATVCWNCSAGTYQNVMYSSFCVSCTPGTFQTNIGAYSCNSCSEGTFASASATVSCLNCNLGQYQSLQGSTGCQNCSWGAYQDVYAGTDCKVCPSGTFQNSTGVTSGAGCIQCGPGYFQNTTGASGCVSCPRATYSNVSGASACSPCPLSLYLSGQTACSLCPPGLYQANSMDTVCTLCNQGINYNPYTGQTSCLSCQQCGPNEYFSRACSVDQNSQCSPCGSCPFGTYQAGSCVRGDSFSSRFTQPTYCPPCPPCPNGTFLSDGCIGGAFPVCSPCTVCEADPLVECTPLSDTICGGISDCRHNASLEVLPWLLPMHYCAQGQYVVGLSSSTGVPACATCPDGTYGPNGLWCEVCAGYKTAYFDASQCVCYQGTVENTRDTCDCLPGNEFLDAGCVPCATGSFDDTLLELGDEWWTQYKACRLCPNGTDSLPGATGCTACPFGMYREAGATELCQNCSETGWYATNPTSRGSCVACNASCDPGYYPTKCPTYAGGDLFLCEPCPGVPGNATSTAPVGATANTACNWACDAGFFQANASACEPCTGGPCPAGYNRSACTPLADSNCDTPCVDPNKPLRNSVWTSGCGWGCAEGYDLSAVDYVLWVQYSCVASGARLFDAWG